MKVDLPPRGKNVTVIGALYEGELYYQLSGSTNKKDVIKFIRDLVIKIGSDVGSAVLILDNHKSHQSHDLADCCAEVGLDMLYLPPYASELNPIELVWAAFKRVWGQLVF